MEDRRGRDQGGGRGCRRQVHLGRCADLGPETSRRYRGSDHSEGCNVILVVAYDSDAILPSIQKINDAGIKAIAYDVQFEDPNALYITFDNIGVGRLMAKEILKAKPEGNYAFIKGDKGDPNATFLFQGITEVLKEAMDSGKIKNVCETFTDALET